MGTALVGQPNVDAGQAWSFGTIVLCVSAPGTATITDVSFKEPTGGMHVDAFATRQSPIRIGGQFLGADTKTLADVGDGFIIGGAPIEDQCPPAADDATWVGGVELGIQVSKSTSAMARANALEVTYETDGSRMSLTIPFGIALCAVGTSGMCPAPS